MSENKKYFYMRLKENFYDSPEMIVLEGMENGYKMSNLLMKMYCRSLRGDGRLSLNEKIPYSPEMLASITRMDIETVTNALKVFVDLGLIEILDSGMIFMLDIQAYIGKSSSEADRKRKYREMIDKEAEKGHLSGQISDKSPPYTEKEIYPYQYLYTEGRASAADFSPTADSMEGNGSILERSTAVAVSAEEAPAAEKGTDFNSRRNQAIQKLMNYPEK